jgi:pimeloyl-ACP methyl ester carboxylesterase
MLRLLIAISSAVLASTAQAATPTPCPAEVQVAAKCYQGADGKGGFYFVAIPQHWNQALVLHTHGGPSMKKPSASDAPGDLKRFALMVREGYAWAGSSYRHAGYGTDDAAQDTDELRALFWKQFGKPKWTLLHGQSWGGNVALRVAEHYGRNSAGALQYDGVLLTSGIVSGGDLAYDFRADLRAVYQYYCQNLPLPQEPAYPLWQGLASESPLSSAEVQARANTCLGLNLSPDQRSPAQARALTNIARVVRVPESAVIHHLSWATTTFRDMVVRQFGGANPFSNEGVVYTGSDDDAALNRGVPRFGATVQGRKLLREDSAVSGKLAVPTMSLHAIDDPTVFVEGEHSFRSKVDQAGAGGLLLQLYTREREHARLAPPQYVAGLASLMEWVQTGQRPMGAVVAARCQTYAQRYGDACHFDLAYQVAPLATRVYERRFPQE